MTYKKPPVRSEYQRNKTARFSLSKQKELLEEANSKDIFAVAQLLGMKVTRGGQTEWQGHTSLVLDRKKNYFYWNGQSLSGNPVDLVSVVQQGARTREDLKQHLKSSIAYLTNTDVAQFDISKVPKQVPFSYPLSDRIKLAEARNYLKNERGLSDETIDFFESKGAIAESMWQNRSNDTPSFVEPVLVFKHYNSQGDLLGATLQGIRYHEAHLNNHASGHLKHIINNSGSYSGMAVDIGSPKRIVVAEASMDLMSYAEAHKDELQDVKLIASDGYKPKVISYYMAELFAKDNPNVKTRADKEAYLNKFDDLAPNLSGLPQNLITFAYDNDKAGRKFVEKFHQTYPNSKNYTQTDFPPLHENQIKNDWNAEIQYQKSRLVEKSTFSQEENHLKITEKEEVMVEKIQMSANESEEKYNSQLKQLETILIQQQQAFDQLQKQYQEVSKTNREILEKLNEKGIPKEELRKSTFSLKENISERLSEAKAKLSSLKAQFEEAVKLKGQNGLKFFLDKTNFISRLQKINQFFENTARAIQSLETQLKVLSGQMVSEDKILALPEPVREVAQEVQQSNIKLGQRWSDSVTQEKEKVVVPQTSKKQENKTPKTEASSPKLVAPKPAKAEEVKALPQKFRQILETTKLPVPPEQREAFIEQLMSGQIKVSDVFTKEEQAGLVKQYNQLTSKPNAFEQRLQAAKAQQPVFNQNAPEQKQSKSM